MGFRVLLVSALISVVLVLPACAANPDLADSAKFLAPGGNTIGGPGVFKFDPNQSNNVMDLSGAPDNVCATIFAISGRVDVSVLDAAGVNLESSIATATPGVGGISAGATACANNVGLVEVKCDAASTETCKGAWRVDKK